MTVAVAPGGQVWTPSGGGTWELGGGGGGNTPSAPLSVTGFGDGYTGLDGSAFVLFGAPASNGGSAITGYTATAYVAGVAQGYASLNPGVIPSMNALTCRCDFTSLPAGTYTFTVHATNANGNGTESAASGATTVSAVISPYYICSGNGERADWGYYSTGFNWNDTTHTYSGQTSSLSLPPSTTCLPYWNDPWNPVGPGQFNIVPYLGGHFVFKVYITAPYVNGSFGCSFRGIRFVHGQCTSTATNACIDGQQNWVTNSMEPTSSGIIDITHLMYQYTQPTANTATNITVGNQLGQIFTTGDFYLWGQSDIDFSNNATINMDSYVVGGTWTVGTWLDVVIPMSVFGLNPGVAGVTAGFIQELRLFTQSNMATCYITNMGFTTT